MTLEQQVTNLELSKQLKELGMKQESFFFWGDYEKEKSWRLIWEGKRPIHLEVNSTVSAFTVAELGEMLPEWVTIDEKEYHGQTNKSGDSFYCSYGEYGKGAYLMNHLEHADTEADARAKMLIYLLENNLIQNNGNK